MACHSRSSSDFYIIETCFGPTQVFLGRSYVWSFLPGNIHDPWREGWPGSCFVRPADLEWRGMGGDCGIGPCDSCDDVNDSLRVRSSGDGIPTIRKAMRRRFFRSIAGAAGVFLSLMSAHFYGSGRSCRHPGHVSFLEHTDLFFGSFINHQHHLHLICSEKRRGLRLKTHFALV
jgi:hypothetical protein